MMKRLIHRHLKRIDELQKLADARELTDEWDELPLLVAEVASKAAKAGCRPVVDVCKWPSTDTPIHAARSILSAALAAVCGKASKSLTPVDVAKRLSVSHDTVLGWIRRAELRASNLSSPGKRPRYAIAESDLEAFLKVRQPAPPLPKRSKRRAASDDDVIEFFK